MATTTTRRPKARPKPKVTVSRNGQIRISSTAHRGPKPKTFRQYVAKRISRWADKRGGSTFGAAARFTSRRMRGTYRIGKRESAAWRKRREERATGGRPARRDVLKSNVTESVARVKKAAGGPGVVQCGGCRQSFTHRAARTHAANCPGTGATPKPASAPKPKTTKAKGKTPAAPTPTPTPPPVPASGTPQLGPKHSKQRAELEKRVRARAWHRENRERRRQEMTRAQRARDRVGRGWGRFTNRMAVCHSCGWTVRDGETHDCKPPHVQQPAPTSTTSPASPASGTTPSPGPAAPGSQNGAPPMTAPASTNGTSAPAANSGPSDASAAGIVAAWSQWSQAHPEFHDQMTNKMQSTRIAMQQAARMVEAFQQWMVAPRQSGGGGFHPMCVQPLSSVAARLAEAGNGFTETILAIERVYQAQLEMYRAGTPSPGEKYLSNGTARS